MLLQTSMCEREREREKVMTIKRNSHLKENEKLLFFVLLSGLQFFVFKNLSFLLKKIQFYFYLDENSKFNFCPLCSTLSRFFLIQRQVKFQSLSKEKMGCKLDFPFFPLLKILTTNGNFSSRIKLNYVLQIEREN